MPRITEKFHMFGDELFAVDPLGRLASWNARADGWDLSFPYEVQQIGYAPNERSVIVLDTRGTFWVRTRTLATEDENPVWVELPPIPEDRGVEEDLGTRMTM